MFALTSMSGTAQAPGCHAAHQAGRYSRHGADHAYEDLYKPAIKNVFAVGYDMANAVEEALVAMMADRYPGKKWALMSQDDDYGENVRTGFEACGRPRSSTIASTQIYKKGQADFSAEMLKVKQAGAEVLLAGGVLGENVAMTKELERIGHKIPVGMTYVSRVPASVKLMGSAGENCLHR
jgi:branched-chain amino acid transport system substrate-binding protein